MRYTSRAIIIKDKKVLLVTGHDNGYYWTPGGEIEKGETSLEALHREVKEELNIEITSVTPYSTYKFEDQKVNNYLVKLTGDIQIGEEVTEYIWFAKGDTTRLSRGFEYKVLPKIIKDGLI